MKKFLAITLAVLMILSSLTGCGKKETEKSLLDTIKERGYIIVGTEGTYFPNSYHDETSGELVGFDVEVAAVIAKYLGVEVQYYETKWESIFTAMDSHMIDIIVNECGYNDDRAAKYEFSNCYAYNTLCILTRNDYNDITSLADISGKVGANETTSLLGKLALENGATLDPVTEMGLSIKEVVDGRAQFTLNYATSFTSYMNEHPESPVKIACYVESLPTSYIPCLKGETELRDAINEAIRQATESGELAQISIKYFGVDITTPVE